MSVNEAIIDSWAILNYVLVLDVSIVIATVLFLRAKWVWQVAFFSFYNDLLLKSRAVQQKITPRSLKKRFQGCAPSYPVPSIWQM